MVKAKKQLRAADLFCGAGGSTLGAVQAGVDVVLAINHWPTAISSHRLNHPGVRHICAKVDDVDPRHDDLPDFDILMASPECTGYSIARGGKPTSDQKRATPWCICRWMETRKPKWVVIENVREFKRWGPLDRNGRPLKARQGETYQAWLAVMRSLGYRVEERLLNAADFGAATKRIRLFIICRRGNRKIHWPEPSHVGRWRAAREIIDWAIPCPSIFGRKKWLSEKTLRRVKLGLPKFVEPYLVKLRGTSATSDVNQPAPTITAGGKHLAVAVPFQFKAMGRNPGATKSIDDPLPTVVAARENHAVVMPYMVANFGERTGQEPRTMDVDNPLAAVTSRGAGQLIMPFLIPRQGFYDCRKDKPAASIEQPLNTITANHVPAALAVPFIASCHGGVDPKRDGTERHHSLDQPLPTLDTSNRYFLTLPFMAQVNHGDDARSGDRVHSVDEPLRTITTKRDRAVIAPYMVDVHDHRKADANASTSLDAPMPTLVTKPGNSLVMPFLTQYNGTGGAESIDEPLTTVTTKSRQGLAVPGIWTPDAEHYEALRRLARKHRSKAALELIDEMERLNVYDVGYRMLEVPELALAQGLPVGYLLYGIKEDQIRQIGNVVCPDVMKAICTAIAGAA